MNGRRMQLIMGFMGVLLLGAALTAGEPIPFYPNGTYLELPDPSSALGFELGDRPVRHP